MGGEFLTGVPVGKALSTMASPMATSITAAVRAATAQGDAARVVQHLSAYPTATFATLGARRDAAAAIAALKGPFANNPALCGAALCALFHVCAAAMPVPLAEALELAKPHLGVASVALALLRVLALHVGTAPFLNGLPRMMQLVAYLICAHHDEGVAHFGARVLLHVLSLGEGTLRGAYGAFGWEQIRVAAVRAAVGARHDTVVVASGAPWRQHVLDTLASRLRAR